MRLLNSITTCIKRLLIMLLLFIISIIFISGVSISIDYNFSKAKENIWDKGIKVLKVAGTVKKAIY